MIHSWSQLPLSVLSYFSDKRTLNCVAKTQTVKSALMCQKLLFKCVKVKKTSCTLHYPKTME